MNNKETEDERRARLRLLAKERVALLSAGHDVVPHYEVAKGTPSAPKTQSPGGGTETDPPDGERTFIEQLEHDYRLTLYVIDQDIEILVRDGKEMRAALLLNESLARILKIYDILQSIYTIVFKSIHMLSRFNSQRLHQLGHRPQETYGILSEYLSPGEAEKTALKNLKILKYNFTHWLINERVINEIEYMITSLKVLIEPDYIPGDEDIYDKADNEGVSEKSKTSRHIPSSVKMEVWRRDGGRCIECASNERLEYDHIIPTSKGGSNTARNVQLLCEKCNRRKSANIQ